MARSTLLVPSRSSTSPAVSSLAGWSSATRLPSASRVLPKPMVGTPAGHR
jgi:hypothetical protein